MDRNRTPIWLTDEPLDIPAHPHLAKAILPAHRQPDHRKTLGSPVVPTQARREALLQAQTEGLILERSDYNATGYKGITRIGDRFKATTREGIGELRDSIIGWFDTAEEAALERARWIANTQSESPLTLCEFKARKRD